MRVRTAEANDMDAVAQMARELAAHVSDPDPGDRAADLVRDGFGADRWFECFVAEADDGTLIGYVLACRRFEAHTAIKRLWIGDLYVRPNRRSSGVGRALIRAVAQRAHGLGCAELSWELWEGNASGRRFYASLGAVVAAEISSMTMPVD